MIYMIFTTTRLPYLFLNSIISLTNSMQDFNIERWHDKWFPLTNGKKAAGMIHVKFKLLLKQVHNKANEFILSKLF